MHVTNFEAETHHFILSFLSGTFDDVQKIFLSTYSDTREEGKF